MKVLSRLKIESRYTGEHGAYASVIPTARSAAMFTILANKLAKLGLAEHVLTLNDFHVTVIYSQNKAPDPSKIPYLQPETIIQAKLMALNIWPGHKNQGVIVAKIHSPALVAVNKFWRNLGCASETFPDYKPHLTLAEGFLENGGELPPAVSTYIQECNANLKETPLKLTFFGHRVEDVS